MQIGELELVVRVARGTGWTLREIGELSPAQLYAIARELLRQESQEEHNQTYATASILAAIYNTMPRKSPNMLTAEDFLTSKEGKTETGTTNLARLAKEQGIEMPKKTRRDDG